MGALLASLPTVTVALCDDGTPLVPGDVSLFSGAKQVAAQLRQLIELPAREARALELVDGLPRPGGLEEACLYAGHFAPTIVCRTACIDFLNCLYYILTEV